MAAPGQTAVRNPAVVELQKVLATYAQITGLTAANPGPVDGIVGTRTVLAVVAVLPHVPKLPSEIRRLATIAPIALAIPQAQAEAKQIITKHASTIAKGIVATAAYQAYTGKPPTSPANGNPTAQVTWVGPTAPGAGNVGQGAPGAGNVGQGAIYFFDARRGVYRVAVRMGLGALGAAYQEVAPSTTPPAGGIPVTRGQFLVQTGRWYETTGAIIGFVAGGAALIGGTVFGIRKAMR